MVGCIIGRAGSKISEIRKTSGARISIAKVSIVHCFGCHGWWLTHVARLLMMKLASVCSPSWVRPRPTRRPSSSSMKTLRPRRCVARSLLVRARSSIPRKNSKLVLDSSSRSVSAVEQDEMVTGLPSCFFGGFRFGTELGSALVLGLFSRSDCRKACYLAGGIRCHDTFYSKKAFRREFYSRPGFTLFLTETTPLPNPFSPTTDSHSHGSLDVTREELEQTATLFGLISGFPGLSGHYHDMINPPPRFFLTRHVFPLLSLSKSRIQPTTPGSGHSVLRYRYDR